MGPNSIMMMQMKNQVFPSFTLYTQPSLQKPYQQYSSSSEMKSCTTTNRDKRRDTYSNAVQNLNQANEPGTPPGRSPPNDGDNSTRLQSHRNTEQ